MIMSGQIHSGVEEIIEKSEPVSDKSHAITHLLQETSEEQQTVSDRHESKRNSNTHHFST